MTNAALNGMCKSSDSDGSRDCSSEMSQRLLGLPAKAVACVVAQHTSSAWSEQCLEFAAYLFLIVLFPSTLIPASVLGVSMTLGSLSLSSTIGSLVDRQPKVRFARQAIVIQKICQSAVYLCFIWLFSSSSNISRSLQCRSISVHEVLQHRQAISSAGLSAAPSAANWAQLVILVSCATVGRLATIAIDLAVDREWVLIITGGNPDQLTLFNTYNRRAWLMCKLVGPLFVSALTSALGYPSTCLALLAASVMTTATELVWIGTVWKAFPALQASEDVNDAGSYELGGDDQDSSNPTPAEPSAGWADFLEFARMPVFMSSLAVSTLYLTTLSFDGIMLSWLKTERAFSDGFIAVMRGFCAVTALGGTVIMPLLTKRLGLARAGAWSIWLEITCLVPVVTCIYLAPSSSTAATSPTWWILNNFIFFMFLAFSRIGLYSYDLVQLQEMQTTLADNPKRNIYMAIQISMQSAFDLGKYAVVLILSRPSDFRWTALISVLTVLSGGIVHAAYLRKQRGHLLHWGSGRYFVHL